MRRLDRSNELYVIGLILKNPTMYIDEMCLNILNALGVAVSVPTICRLMRLYGITRKRMRYVAMQRSASLRGSFMAHCYNIMFSTDKFVWIDETGSDRRNYLRKYGYSLRGTRAVQYTHLTRGSRVNAIAALCHEGIVTYELTTSTVNSKVFFNFL